MPKIAMYYHGGSGNHGCEAIVRSTAKLLGREIVLYSSSPDEDCQYNINDIVALREDISMPLKKTSLRYLSSAVSHKLKNDDYLFTVNMHRSFFKDVKRGDIYLSIGGDNYCYPGQDILGYYNKEIHKRGAKTVLWGCSVEPELITEQIKKDLALYDLIVARESISYNVLREINPNTIYTCDPAFTMDRVETELPETFIPDRTVGVNLSPLIVAREKTAGLAYESFVNLVSYILNNTDYNIALIPHVVKRESDDRILLERIQEDMRCNERICLISDRNCLQLKDCISKCSLFVGARTHATIAAYSSIVPTLTVGYSTKAIGIARDLFGTDSNYVLPIQSLDNPNDVTSAFIWLDSNQETIRHKLTVKMRTYTDSINNGSRAIEELWS